MDFIKTSFIQGMNLQFDPTRIGDDQYPLLVNGRNRKGTICPVKKHRKLSNAPVGKYQGLYAAGQYLVLFAAGEAHVLDTAAGGNFAQIAGVALDANVDTIFAALVSGSTVNFSRVPTGSSASSAVNLTTAVNKSDAALVCQDGVSQPAAIFANGTGRILQTYEQWSGAAREYVPIGTNMMFHNGVLYVLAPDGRTIYRSISGRPLDFMVRVGLTGDKSGAEDDGGAGSTSHAVGFDTLTCLAALNSPDNGFYVASSNFSTRMVPDYETTMFAEPLFDNVVLFPTGPVNQFSFMESMGDNVFINVNGIRSFNAALQERNEGRNELFSAQVLHLFGDDPSNPIAQAGTCIGKFDNYLLFSCQTVYGDAIVVYDETLKRFVGIDQQDGIGRIKQFAHVQRGSVNKLYFITDANEIYEAYGDTVTATAKLYIGDYCTQKPSVNHCVYKLHVVVIDAQETGTLIVTPFVDGKEVATQRKSKPITESVTMVVPRTVPFGAAATRRVQNLSYGFQTLPEGWKAGFLLELNCMAQISHVQCRSTDDEADTNIKDEAAALARHKA